MRTRDAALAGGAGARWRRQRRAALARRRVRVHDLLGAVLCCGAARRGCDLYDQLAVCATPGTHQFVARSAGVELAISSEATLLLSTISNNTSPLLCSSVVVPPARFLCVAASLSAGLPCCV
eukprot:6173909-Pleurochrysis_carterae.AAC.3